MGEREKVTLLATCIMEFVDFINRNYEAKYHFLPNKDKLIRLKLITEEFHFHTISSELLRLNEQSLDEQQTPLLIDRFQKALVHVVEYVDNNLNDLFIFSGRIYTLQHYCWLLTKKERIELS